MKSEKTISATSDIDHAAVEDKLILFEGPTPEHLRAAMEKGATDPYNLVNFAVCPQRAYHEEMMTIGKMPRLLLRVLNLQGSSDTKLTVVARVVEDCARSLPWDGVDAGRKGRVLRIRYSELDCGGVIERAFAW